MTSPLHRLLVRQCKEARKPDGSIDIDAVLCAVSASYCEHDIDVKRIDRANALMAGELEEALELREAMLRERSARLEELEVAQAAVTAGEVRIRHLAYHDPLTDLANRMLFKELLELSIQNAKRHERFCAVLFIDLDRFKLINDSLGHAAGDVLLVEMANRLRAGVRSSDVVARIGGDEFLVLLNEVPDAEHAKAVATSLLTSVCQSVDLNGQEWQVSASIGIAMYPNDGIDGETLTKNADAAMYLAKTEGKNSVRLFSRQLNAHSPDRLGL